MIIGGLQKFSLLDYPNKISAIVFTQGCNFRCHFCYNPMLVGPVVSSKVEIKLGHKEKDQIPPGSKQNSQLFEPVKEDDLFLFLKNRVGKLEAIVITGGEPTLHSDLPEFIKKIKDLGFLVKLDTNGTNPDRIKELISKKLINYIAMDIKAPLDKYERTVGVKLDFKNIKKSIDVIMESGLPYEFRSTLAPNLINKQDIEKMGELIRGADNWYLQTFRSDTDLVDNEFEGQKSFSRKEMADMKKIAESYVKNCQIR